MPGSAAIDVAIGLILMYLMLSLLCTTINEFIATKLRLRADTLAAAIKKLIDDKDIYARFYQHGLIVGNAHAAATGAQSTAEAVKDGAQSTVAAVEDGARAAAGAARKLMGKKAAPAVAPGEPPAEKINPVDDHPSYLSGKTVALALLAGLNTGKDVPVFDDLKTAAENLPESSIRDVLLASLTEANGKFDQLRTSVATWFDDSMERLSGAYKRKIKWISMLVGLAVAIVFNADSLRVATSLWNDGALRASIVQVATETAKRTAPSQPGQTTAPSQSAEKTAPSQSGEKTAPSAEKTITEKELGDQIQSTEDALRSFPIGWSCVDKDKKTKLGWWECVKAAPGTVGLWQILGWLLTAAALSLGAPFWFDLLNRFINLRGAGEKPARADGKPAK